MKGAGSCVGKKAQKLELKIIPISERSLSWNEIKELPYGQIGEVISNEFNFSS